MLTFHIITFGISVLFWFMIWIILRSRITAIGIVCSSFFAFLSSELICRVIFYKYMNFRHLFLHGFMNFTSDKAIKTVFIVIAINAAVLIFAMLLKIIFVNKKALFSVKKYKVFPVKAVQYFIIFSVVLFLVMSTADVMMPQFAYWDIDDSMINQNTKIHAETNNNLVELMYPLIKLDNNYDKQPDEKIILIIGDSFVWGDGSSNVNVLWWRMLQQRMLDEGFGKCRIVAVGLSGASTQDQLYWLENTTMIEDIKPDMIIIGYVVNDPDHCEYTGTYSILHKNDIQNPAMWTPHNRNMNHWWDNKFLSGLYLLFPNIERKFQNDLDEREINMTKWPIKEIVTAEDGRKVEVDVYNKSLFSIFEVVYA